MLSRTIGKIIRGNATPVQIVMAGALGGAIGFMPGFLNAPGLTIALLLLLVILNANLGFAALIGLLAKPVSILLLPVSFALGQALLDGPLQPLFRTLVNAPVFALFGFERYVATGGLVLGLVLGGGAGAVVAGAVNRLRRKLGSLEEGSEAYQRITGKRSMRFLAWLFLGRKAKGTHAEHAAKKVGNPIRPLGVVFGVLVVVFLWVAGQFLSGPIAEAALVRGLEKANGATVDVRDVEVNLKQGRVALTGLAMADPNALSTDLLRAARVEADLSLSDLLRKRIAVDKVVVSEASSGEARVVPGRRVGKAPEPPPPPPGEGKTIDDYLRDAQIWKERLAQVRRVLEDFGKRADEGRKGPGEESQREANRRAARDLGYRRVIASHLIEGSPTLLVREILVEGLTSPRAPGETFDVRATSVSTQPWLVQEPPHVVVGTRSNRISADVLLASVAATPGESRIGASVRGMSGDTIGSMLRTPGGPPLSGGTVDASIDGRLSLAGAPSVDLPLNITLHDTTLSLPEIGEAPIERMSLAVQVRGPIDNPRLSLSEEALADALVAAGQAKLAGKLRGEADKAIGEATKEIGEKVGDEIGDAAQDVLGGLLGGGKKKEEKKKEDKKPPGR